MWALVESQIFYRTPEFEHMMLSCNFLNSQTQNAGIPSCIPLSSCKGPACPSGVSPATLSRPALSAHILHLILGQ